MRVDYRKNLILYWQQYFPDWSIPVGYHVHHIKPKCTFEDKNDPCIHHPRNLIALHPDDHAAIHKCRGDVMPKSGIFRMLDYKHSNESKQKISKALSGRTLKPFSDEHLVNMSKAQLGKKNTLEHIKKVADANRGSKRSAETKTLMSKSQLALNKVNSTETKLKMSKAKTGLK